MRGEPSSHARRRSLHGGGGAASPAALDAAAALADPAALADAAARASSAPPLAPLPLLGERAIEADEVRRAIGHEEEQAGSDHREAPVHLATPKEREQADGGGDRRERDQRPDRKRFRTLASWLRG
jgi:hypothetical protein